MNLKEKIQNDFKEAFKAKDQVALSTLKMLNAEIKNAEIAKRTRLVKKADGSVMEDDCCVLEEGEIIEVISREIKKRRDSIDMYEKGGRGELAENEKKEMDILFSYLPAQLNEDEIRELVKKAIEKTSASGAKEMGKVMGILSPQTKGRADGAMVSRIVKELLG
ncbi:MAG: GatB/YqeY domain-containing protein [Candidatus Paceibacterota bacterium]